MKKILLPLLSVLIILLTLTGCDLLGIGRVDDAKKLLFIDVTSDKLVFYRGDNVKDYITVESYYSDGTSGTLTEDSYTTDLTDDLIDSTATSFTVSYTENGITRAKKVLIVNKTIFSLEVTADRDGFIEGNNIKDFLTVKVLYADGSEKVLGKDDYTTDLTGDILCSDTTCTAVTYSENGVTMTKDLQVLLKEKITKNWFENFSAMDKADVTSISFCTQAPEGASLVNSTPDLSYYRKDNDIYVVGSKIVFDADASDMFYNFTEATQIVFEDNIDTSRVTNMYRMFGSCRLIETLDLSGFDTSSVQNMNWMFTYCEKLQSLDLSNFDTSEVTDMGYMFCRCYELNSLDISSFNTSNVENMGNMFNLCLELENLDLTSFDVSNVSDVSSMFTRCGYTGTQVKIAPWYTAFFNGTGLSDDSVWQFNPVTFTYTKILDD